MGSRFMGQNKIITIVDYNMGNIRSIAKAFNSFDVAVLISNRREDIKNADRLILPGVGAFSDGMKNLRELGLVDILNQEVLGDIFPR